MGGPFTGVEVQGPRRGKRRERNLSRRGTVRPGCVSPRARFSAARKSSAAPGPGDLTRTPPPGGGKPFGTGGAVNSFPSQIGKCFPIDGVLKSGPGEKRRFFGRSVATFFLFLLLGVRWSEEGPRLFRLTLFLPDGPAKKPLEGGGGDRLIGPSSGGSHEDLGFCGLSSNEKKFFPFSGDVAAPRCSKEVHSR